jgi:hypothetical protein
MEIETIKNILDFLEKEDNKKHKDKGTLRWKFMFNEPLTKEELNVKGDLDISGVNIQHLPKGLKVIGNADFRFSSLKTFPEKLFVEGDLNFEWTSFKSLPGDLYVGRNLDLSYSDVETLSKGLKVKRDLHIVKTPLAKLSDEKIREMVKPDGYIKGNIER